MMNTTPRQLSANHLRTFAVANTKTHIDRTTCEIFLAALNQSGPYAFYVLEHKSTMGNRAGDTNSDLEELQKAGVPKLFVTRCRKLEREMKKEGDALMNDNPLFTE